MEIKITINGKEIENNYILKIKDNMNIKVFLKSDDIHFLAGLATKEEGYKEGNIIINIAKEIIENNKITCNCNFCNEFVEAITKGKKCDCLVCQLKRKLGFDNGEKCEKEENKKDENNEQKEVE